MIRFHRFLVILLLFAEFALLSGCVRRKLTVRTDPPGAVATLDNVELGKTPITRDFDYYGKRELKLVKEGYEPHTQMIHLRTPWYEWVGFDFFSEVLVPGTLNDEPEFAFKLKPQQVVSPDDLIAEGERLKALAHSSGTYRVSSGRGVSNVPQSNVPSPTDTVNESIYPPYPTPEIAPPQQDANPLTAPIPNYTAAPEPQ